MHVFDKSKASMPTQGFVSPATEAHPSRAADRSTAGRDSVWFVARVLGALSLLAVGAVHLQQFVEIYSAIPTIGTLFVLNFAGATTIGLGLLAPVERLLGRWGGAVVALLALGGIALAATAFVFLLISERTPLFGFMEPGYDPPAIMAARVAEVATVGFLGTFLIARFARRMPWGVRGKAGRTGEPGREQRIRGGM